MAEVVSSVEPLISPQVASRSLSLVLEVPARLQARADREKLEQILLNLLSNAVKFTPSGGTITVRAGRSTRIVGTIDISVTDTGVGIPADKLEAIFEPFVQVDSAKTRGTEGTGLGLAISRDLARGMKGELRATSDPGAGSTFTLELPAA
jgi:signal transduction histidine kinase